MLLKIKTLFVNFNQDVIDTISDRVLLFRIRYLLSLKRKTSIFEKICSLLNDGISLGGSLSMMQKIYNKRNSGSLEYKMVQYLFEKYTNTPRASYIFQPFFDPISMSIITAMEEANSTHKGLLLAKKQLELRNKMGKQAVNAMTLIFGALLTILGICVAMKLFVFDKLTKTMPMVANSSSVKSVHAFLDTVVSYSPFIFLLILAFAGFSIWSIPNQINKRPKFMPPWNVMDRLNSALFLFTLARLTDAQMPIFRSLGLLKKHSTRYMSSWAAHIQQRQLQNMSMGASLACDLFDKQVRIEIEAYSSVKDVAKNFEVIANMVVGITEAKLKQILMMSILCSIGVILLLNGVLALSVLNSLGNITSM